MGFRNMPSGSAFSLAELISCRPGQVSSMALTTRDSAFDATLLAFADGEMVSEEAYADDVLYLVVEGSPAIVLPDRTERLAHGQALMVPAGVLHAVEGPGAFKLLQVSAS